MLGDSTDLFGDPVITDRRCTRCKLVKPLEAFRLGRSRSGNGRSYPRRWHTCRECMKAKMREYGRSRRGASAKARARCKRYGLGVAEYELMLAAQNGLCAICRQPEPAIDPRTNTARNLSVDHCHTTGKVRGLLCTLCNQGIGQFRDDPAILRLAIEYLKRHS